MHLNMRSLINNIFPDINYQAFFDNYSLPNHLILKDSY